MSLGVGGISDIRYPLFEVGGQQFVYLQGDIFAALLAFEYQHAVKDWLAIYLKFGLIGRLGSDIGTLLQQGVNYATTFDIGWMIKIYRKKKFALSATFGLTNGNYSLISLQNFVNDIISSMPNSSLIKSNNSLYGTVGVKAAYGFNDFIGVHIVTDIGYGETIQRQLENKIFTTLGFNADLNFSNMIKTPIALSLGYFFSNYPQSNNDLFFNHNEFLFQLNYIGRTNFILSLDLTASKEFAGKNVDTLWLRTAMFSMRYLF